VPHRPRPKPSRRHLVPQACSATTNPRSTAAALISIAAALLPPRPRSRAEREGKEAARIFYAPPLAPLSLHELTVAVKPPNRARARLCAVAAASDLLFKFATPFSPSLCFPRGR
jgi:hypothetical protein